MADHDPRDDRPVDVRRLAAMNDMLNPTSVGMMRLRGGERILDVGSGVGHLTRAMARTAGRGGEVIGIERDAELLSEAAHQARLHQDGAKLEFRQGDADRLPLEPEEWGSFDLAHARFVLEYLGDPQAVVRGMVKAVRPGGRVILEDDDHTTLRLWPEPPGFLRLWEAHLRSFERFGGDPAVGRRLVDLLHAAGALPMRSSSLSVSSCAGSPSFRPLLGIVSGILEGGEEGMLASGRIDREAYAAGMTELRRWGDGPNSALWYATCWAEGKRV